MSNFRIDACRIDDGYDRRSTYSALRILRSTLLLRYLNIPTLFIIIVIIVIIVIVIVIIIIVMIIMMMMMVMMMMTTMTMTIMIIICKGHRSL